MNLALWLCRTATRTPDAPALFSGAEVHATYSTFAERSAAIGAGLRASGVQPGDRVAIFMGNCPEYLEVLYAIWFAGAVAVPINAKLHPREAAWITQDAGAAFIFTSGLDTQTLHDGLEPHQAKIISTQGTAYSDLVATAPLQTPTQRSPDDLAWLFYTSGTTGKPKGVMISFANIIAMTSAYFVDVDDVSKQDAILYAAPMSHGAGLYNFMFVLRGARHVIPKTGAFDPDEILDLAPKINNVSMFAAPTMVRRLVDAAKRRGTPGEGIKTIVYAGGPMYLADIIDAVNTMGPRFVQIYGQGECPMAITALSRGDVADRAHPEWRARLASVGRAQSVVQIRIVDTDGNDLPNDETGEILVAGTPVMLGYWNNAKATDDTIQNGWLRTGDMGRIDADGYLTLQDRSKDVIISGGSNIYPREIEEVLLLHPMVHEVAVIGKPDPEWGEAVVAFIVIADGAQITRAELDKLCTDHIARFKRPKHYIFMNALPKNNYGKVLKTELRKHPL